MKRVSILGSCVTRDIYRFVEESHSYKYYARTSLISLMSQPLDICQENIELSSDFQKRTVFQDCQKSFFQSLEAFDSDYLIIDFIDERFDLMKYQDSYVTYSVEFRNSKIESLYPFERIARHSESTHQLWEAMCKEFINKLSKFITLDKIILHEAYWSSEYTEEGQLKSFEKKLEIERNNQILKRYYDYFKAQIRDVRTVNETPLSDSANIWGLSPYHYTDQYYRNILQQINCY